MKVRMITKCFLAFLVILGLSGCSKHSLFTDEKTTLDSLGDAFNAKLTEPLKYGDKNIAALTIGAIEGREYHNETFDFEVYRYNSATKNKMNEVFNLMNGKCKKSLIKGYFLICDESEPNSAEGLFDAVDGKDIKIQEVKKAPAEAAPAAAPAEAAPAAAPAEAAPAAAPAEAAPAPAADANVDSSFTAVFTCGMGAGGPEHINILACFSGGSDGVDTDLELRNGDKYGLYKVYNLSNLGSERRDGFYIKLNKNFSIKAQNADETLILGLKIIGDKTGKTYFQKQVSHFGVISVSN